MGPRSPACAERARFDMPKISYTKKYDYHTHQNEGRYFGIVYDARTGKRLSRQFPLPFAVNDLTALRELKELFENEEADFVDYVPRHD